MLKKISIYLMAILYVAAGINHFVHPQSYLAIIPGYLPWPAAINFVSGVFELALGIMIFFAATRKVAATGIIILLILFIPAHIYMIQKGGQMSNTLTWPVWAVWLRLFPLQFLLMAWAWYNRK